MPLSTYHKSKNKLLNNIINICFIVKFSHYAILYLFMLRQFAALSTPLFLLTILELQAKSIKISGFLQRLNEHAFSNGFQQPETPNKKRFLKFKRSIFKKIKKPFNVNYESISFKYSWKSLAILHRISNRRCCHGDRAPGHTLDSTFLWG